MISNDQQKVDITLHYTGI